MLNFSEANPIKSLEKNIQTAIKNRIRFFNKNETTAYRLINGEGDGIPGLLVDRYNTILVFQISTLGIELQKNNIIDFLLKQLDRIDVIYEKSNNNSRTNEGLNKSEGILWSVDKKPSLITKIKENNAVFEVDIKMDIRLDFTSIKEI